MDDGTARSVDLMTRDEILTKIKMKHIEVMR